MIDDKHRFELHARALVRCTRKGCRKDTRRVEITTQVTQWAHLGRMAESRAVWMNGRWAGYRDKHDLARMLVPDFQCKACGGRSWSFSVIRGSFSEAVKCGAKCRSAVGPSCDCQCGGERHGEAHSLHMV